MSNANESIGSGNDRVRVYPFFELACVSINVHQSEKSVKRFEPGFVALDFKPADARALAAQLIAAAEWIEKWEAEVEAYFAKEAKGKGTDIQAFEDGQCHAAGQDLPHHEGLDAG